jgi:predicted  nucleic acid-binding Zn-ribbon protein
MELRNITKQLKESRSQQADLREELDDIKRRFDTAELNFDNRVLSIHGSLASKQDVLEDRIENLSTSMHLQARLIAHSANIFQSKHKFGSLFTQRLPSPPTLVPNGTSGDSEP